MTSLLPAGYHRWCHTKTGLFMTPCYAPIMIVLFGVLDDKEAPLINSNTDINQAFYDGRMWPFADYACSWISLPGLYGTRWDDGTCGTMGRGGMMVPGGPYRGDGQRISMD